MAIYARRVTGIKKNAQRLVMRRVHELRKTFKPRNEDYRQDLRLHLQHLSALLDELLKQLSDAQAPTNDGKHSVQKAWPKVFNLISGAVLLSVNAKLAPFDPVTSALSSTLGGTMVSKALED